MQSDTLYDEIADYKISPKYDSKAEFVLYEGDNKELIQQIPDRAVDLIITSPPYNVGKEYETRTEIETYLETQAETIKELHRILADNGSICWQVGNYVEKGEVFPLDIYYYPIFKNLGMKLRNRVIWHFGHGLHARDRYSGRYETLMWFTKSDDYLFHLDEVRIPSKYPGKRHYKGKNKGKPSGNPRGKNPSDYWPIIFRDWEEAVWDIPNCKSNHPEKTVHPAQFPIELVERCILAHTDEGDTVYDPFSGVGSSLVAALKLNRKAIGSEKVQTYNDIAKNRIKQLSNGTLSIRPMGQPVHVPTGKEKVAQIPLEWEKSLQET